VDTRLLQKAFKTTSTRHRALISFGIKKGFSKYVAHTHRWPAAMGYYYYNFRWKIVKTGNGTNSKAKKSFFGLLKQTEINKHFQWKTTTPIAHFSLSFPRKQRAGKSLAKNEVPTKEQRKTV